MFRDQLAVDTDAYLAHAETLLERGGYFKPGTEIPTAFRPPLLPLFYAGILWLGGGVWAIGFLQVLLGTATVWYGGRTAENLTNQDVGFATAIFIAGNPILIYSQCTLMTETLFTFLLAYLFFRASLLKSTSPLRDYFLLGCIGGLLALCRPGIWPFYGLMLIGTVLLGLKAGAFRKAIMRTAVVASGLLLVVSPWVLRNTLVMGSPIVMTTHGGYTLLLGNNDAFYDEVVRQPWGTTWQEESLLAWQARLEEEMVRDLGAELARLEIPRDRWMKEQAYSWIKQHPGKFVEASWLRVRRFWAISPTVAPQWTDLFGRGIGMFYLLLYAIAACGIYMWFKHGRNFIPQFYVVLSLLFCVTSFFLVHTVYWSNMRMRAPVDVCLAILASALYLWDRSETLSDQGIDVVEKPEKE